MFFLNLTAGEFFGLLGLLGGTITALYFLDRSKRRKVVSTLQFWVGTAAASQQRSRKRVNQPWSLLLQLLSLALLLLALAQLQWGTRPAAGRDHVVLLDTSSWSGARDGNGTVLRTEMDLALRYLAALPMQDRVLLARADSLITPVTAFTADRERTRIALRETATAFSALDLPGALLYAEQAQRLTGGVAGEIVYVGPQRVNDSAAGLSLPRNLRVLAIPVQGPNYGIRRMDVRRGEADASSWQVEVTLMNYGSLVQPVKLRTQFAGTHFALRSYQLLPHQEVTAEYNFVTNTEGKLSAELDGTDVLPQDNRASLRLPGMSYYAVTVYTRRSDLFRPLLNSDRRVSATFLDPSQWNLHSKADLVIIDGFSVPHAPAVSSIWINAPQDGSPIPVKAVVGRTAIKNWNSSSLIAAGLHAREDRISQAKIFETQPNDLVLASTSEGPTVVLRPNTNSGNKLAVIGFDPLSGPLRYTVTTPLLFANLLDWMAPEALRATDLKVGRVGSASVKLDSDETSTNLKVTTEDGLALPFTVHEQTLQFFSNKPTTAHIASGSRERVLSLVLPDVATLRWTPALSTIATGLPAFPGFGALPLDLWQWLACFGAIGLVTEWLLYGRSRTLVRVSRKNVLVPDATKDQQEELVAR